MEENEPAQLREIIAKSEVKFQEILLYCEPHVEQKWAATIIACILECDFRDAAAKLAEAKLQ